MLRERREIAMTIARLVHKGKSYGPVDGGGDYFRDHVLEVEKLIQPYVEAGTATDAFCVALLHDVLEDCEPEDRGSLDDLIALGCGRQVLHTVLLLTKPKGSRRETLGPYLHAVSFSRVARLVKLADRVVNVRAARKNDRSGLVSMYRKEREAFGDYLYRGLDQMDNLWALLDDAFDGPVTW